jgi:hypothetical protein
MSRPRGQPMRDSLIDDSDDEATIMAALGDTRSKIDDDAVAKAQMAYDERKGKMDRKIKNAGNILNRLQDLQASSLYAQWRNTKTRESARVLWDAIVSIAGDAMPDDYSRGDPLERDLGGVIEEGLESLADQRRFYKSKIITAKTRLINARAVRESNILARRQLVQQWLDPAARKEQEEQMCDDFDRQSRPQGRLQVRMRNAAGGWVS